MKKIKEFIIGTSILWLPILSIIITQWLANLLGLGFIG